MAVDRGAAVALQRAVGNRATSALMAGRPLRPRHGDSPAHVQRQPKPDAKAPKKAEPKPVPPRDATIQDVVKVMNGLGGPYADLKAWRDTIKPGKFLGHTIDPGVRPEFQAMLDTAAAAVGKEFKKSGNPVPSGYGIRSIGGYREGIHPHGAGVAIDIDAGDNPFIMHEGDQNPTAESKKNGVTKPASTGETTLTVELKPVYHRIAEFVLNDPVDGEQSIIPKLIGSGASLPKGKRVSRRDRVEQYYDRLAKESGAMRTYFSLMTDEAALKTHLATTWTTVHPKATPPDATDVIKEMWHDYALLGGAVPKGGPPGVADFEAPREAGRPFHPKDRAQKDPAAGFLTIPKEVVLGLGQAVPRWGAIDFGVQSGDVMHFDDTYGIGGPFFQAKAPAQAAVDAENKATAEAAKAGK